MKKGYFLKCALVLLLSALTVTSCGDKKQPENTDKPNNETTQTDNTNPPEKTPDGTAEDSAALPVYDIPLVKSLNITDETPGDYLGIYALSDGYFKIASHDLDVGIMKADGTVVLPTEYSTLRAIHDNVTAVRDEMGMWSYFNVESGKFLVEKQDSLFDFSEGIGLYTDGKVYRFINPDGTPAIDSIFYEAAPFSDGLARALKEDGFGYIDKNGEMVIYCDYIDFDDFHEGLARISDGEKKGYLNKDGEPEFFMDCNGIFNYKDGLAAFTVGNKIGYIDKEGRVAVEPLYDRPAQNDDAYFRFECGVAPVIKDGKYGFINRKGELVVDAIYDLALYATDGIIRVRKDKLYGYITTSGEVITECIFNEASEFTDGVAMVMKDNKYYYINKNGEELTTERFDDASKFCDGTAFVVREGTLTWTKVTLGEVVEE